MAIPLSNNLIDSDLEHVQLAPTLDEVKEADAGINKEKYNIEQGLGNIVANEVLKRKFNTIVPIEQANKELSVYGKATKKDLTQGELHFQLDKAQKESRYKTVQEAYDKYGTPDLGQKLQLMGNDLTSSFSLVDAAIGFIPTGANQVAAAAKLAKYSPMLARTIGKIFVEEGIAEGRLAWQAAMKYGAKGVSKEFSLGSRMGISAINGAVGNLLAEPISYANEEVTGIDYGFKDTLMNITGGLVIGGLAPAVHSAFKAAAAGFKKGRMNKLAEVVPNDVIDREFNNIDSLADSVPEGKQILHTSFGDQPVAMWRAIDNLTESDATIANGIKATVSGYEKGYKPTIAAQFLNEDRNLAMSSYDKSVLWEEEQSKINWLNALEFTKTPEGKYIAKLRNEQGALGQVTASGDTPKIAGDKLRSMYNYVLIASDEERLARINILREKQVQLTTVSDLAKDAATKEETLRNPAIINSIIGKHYPEKNLSELQSRIRLEEELPLDEHGNPVTDDFMDNMNATDEYNAAVDHAISKYVDGGIVDSDLVDIANEIEALQVKDLMPVKTLQEITSDIERLRVTGRDAEGNIVDPDFLFLDKAGDVRVDERIYDDTNAMNQRVETEKANIDVETDRLKAKGVDLDKLYKVTPHTTNYRKVIDVLQKKKDGILRVVTSLVDILNNTDNVKLITEGPLSGKKISAEDLSSPFARSTKEFNKGLTPKEVKEVEAAVPKPYTLEVVESFKAAKIDYAEQFDPIVAKIKEDLRLAQVNGEKYQDITVDLEELRNSLPEETVKLLDEESKAIANVPQKKILALKEQLAETTDPVKQEKINKVITNAENKAKAYENEPNNLLDIIVEQGKDEFKSEFYQQLEEDIAFSSYRKEVTQQIVDAATANGLDQEHGYLIAHEIFTNIKNKDDLLKPLASAVDSRKQLTEMLKNQYDAVVKRLDEIQNPKEDLINPNAPVKPMHETKIKPVPTGEPSPNVVKAEDLTHKDFEDYYTRKLAEAGISRESAKAEFKQAIPTEKMVEDKYLNNVARAFVKAQGIAGKENIVVDIADARLVNEMANGKYDYSKPVYGFYDPSKNKIYLAELNKSKSNSPSMLEVLRHELEHVSDEGNVPEGSHFTNYPDAQTATKEMLAENLNKKPDSIPVKKGEVPLKSGVYAPDKEVSELEAVKESLEKALGITSKERTQMGLSDTVNMFSNALLQIDKEITKEQVMAAEKMKLVQKHLGAMTGTFKYRMANYLSALMSNSYMNFQGASDNIENAQQLYKTLLAGMGAELKTKKASNGSDSLYEFFNNPNNHQSIQEAKELVKLFGEDYNAFPVKPDIDAYEVAKVMVNRVDKPIINAYRKVGSDVTKIHTALSLDISKLHAAVDILSNREQAFSMRERFKRSYNSWTKDNIFDGNVNALVNYFWKELDHEATFHARGKYSTKDKQEVLVDYFQKLLKAEGDITKNFRDKKLYGASDRDDFLILKSEGGDKGFAAKMRVLKNFGFDDSRSQVINDATRSYEKIGIMKYLGQDPYNMIADLVDMGNAFLTKEGKTSKLITSRDSDSLEMHFKNLDGTTRFVGNSGLSTLNLVVTTLTNFKLGQTAVKSLGDIATQVSILQYKGLQEGFLPTLMDTMKALKDANSGMGNILGEMLGVFGDVIRTEQMDTHNMDRLANSIFDKVNNSFMKWSGINPQTHWFQRAMALATSNMMSKLADKEFSEFGKGSAFTNNLNRYSMTKQDWDIMRKFGITSYGEMASKFGKEISSEQAGKTVMIPEIISQANLHDIAKFLNVSLEDAAIARTEATEKLAMMLYDTAQEATTRPTARIRKYTNRGLPGNTLGGSVMRNLTRFKSFPMAWWQQNIGRLVYKNFDVSGEDTAFNWLAKGFGSYGKDVAGYLTFYGMLMMTINAGLDIAKGNKPMPIVSEEGTLNPAFAQRYIRETAPLIGDIIIPLIDEHDYKASSSIANSILGPVAGSTLTAGDQLSNAFRGNRSPEEKASMFTARVVEQGIKNLTPSNLFYADLALKLAVMNKINQLANPDTYANKEDQLKKRTGQEYQEWYDEAHDNPSILGMDGQ